MKKTTSAIIIVVVLVALIFGAPLAFAADFGQGIIPPNSPLNFIQSFGEDERLALTFNKEGKVDYLVKLTDRRVSEMQDQPEAGVAARYEQHFAQLEQLAKQVQNQQDVAQKIADNSLRQQEVLAQVYGQVPAVAQNAILNAQENSSKNVAAVLEKVQGAEQSQQYVQRVAQIVQAEKLKRQPQVPKEEESGGVPGTGQPKQLNPLQGTQPGLELNQLNPTNGNNSGQEPQAPVEQAQPVNPY